MLQAEHNYEVQITPQLRQLQKTLSKNMRIKCQIFSTFHPYRTVEIFETRILFAKITCLLYTNLLYKFISVLISKLQAFILFKKRFFTHFIFTALGEKSLLSLLKKIAPN